ncbi:FAD-dependent oxidoreductase [Streptomyces sp. NPDC005336]|uniref:FAD-dependent oxidoreductase n=1 Tax=Streptomyces sp. NPDC005336 TaxID=3157035 RepID=UPI0033ABD822
MAPTYDVIVLGLGGMGSAAAARGVRVLGLEKFGPVHNRGSSHGGSRVTRQSYSEDPAYAPLLLRSYELYERLERDTGREVAPLCGGVMAATRMYSNTPDEHFVITRHPAHTDSVTVACGFSGHGFEFVPVVGEILADLALTGDTPHPIELFDPRRLIAAPA